MGTTVDLLKKHKQNNGFAEGAFVGVFTTVYRYMERLIEQGGLFTLLILPVFEGIKAGLYWMRSIDNGDNSRKIMMNRAFYILKATATSLGVGLVLSGFMTEGFGVVIAGGYAATLRYLVKSADYALQGNVKKTENNLMKSMLLGLIVGGFTLLTFYPTFGLIGWSMVLASTTFIALPGIPRLLTTMLGMIKQDEAIIVKQNEGLVQKLVDDNIKQQPSLYLPSQSLTEGKIPNEQHRQIGLDPSKR